MADVPSDLNSWSATASSNSPTDSTTIGGGLADNLQALQAVVRGYLAAKGSDIASSSAPDVAAVQGLYHDITGTNTVTGLGSSATAGIWKILQTDSTPMFKHSTAMAMPGAADYTAATGDVLIFFCEATNQWRCISAMRAASEPLAFATQAQQEAGTSTVTAVTPGRQHYHPSAAKVWCNGNFGGTIGASYNMTSITDEGTGDVTITFDTDFSSTDYAGLFQVETSTNVPCTRIAATPAAGSMRCQVFNADGLAALDGNEWHFAAYGDQ